MNWWSDHRNIAALIRWLDDRGELGDVTDAAYLVSKPWKYTNDYERMQQERTRS